MNKNIIKQKSTILEAPLKIEFTLEDILGIDGHCEEYNSWQWISEGDELEKLIAYEIGQQVKNQFSKEIEQTSKIFKRGYNNLENEAKEKIEKNVKEAIESLNKFRVDNKSGLSELIKNEIRMFLSFNMERDLTNKFSDLFENQVKDYINENLEEIVAKYTDEQIERLVRVKVEQRVKEALLNI